MVNPFLHLFARLEERQLLGLDGDLLARFRIASGVALVLLHEETAEAPNFHALALGHGVRHVIEENLNDPGGLGLGDVGFGLQRGDQLQLVHASSSEAPVWATIIVP